jgi:hypothetical protein
VWQRRRRAARECYEAEHTPEMAAERLLTFLEKTF